MEATTEKDRLRFPVTLLLITVAALALFFTLWQFIEVFLVAPRVDLHTLHLLHAVRGVAASLLVAAFVALYLLHQPARILADADVGASYADVTRKRSLEHLRWLIQARWVAIGVTLALIIIAVPLTSIVGEARLPVLLLWWCALVAANVIFSIVLDDSANCERQIELQIAIDLVILTGLLNAAGGLENPLSIAYLFHVILAGILLPHRKAWLAAAMASALFSFLAVGELMEWLPHSAIKLFPHEVVGEHAAHDALFVSGRLASMIGAMFLSAHFTTLATEKIRCNEAALQRAATAAMLGQRQLEGVIEAAGFGMMVTGSDGQVQWVNDRFFKWMGLELVAGSAAHQHDGPRPCFVCPIAETVTSGLPQENEIAIATENEGTRYFRQRTTPVRDTDGHIVQVVQVIEDVTTRKALEAEAMHSGRLTVLGQLAAGVAHEIGNPLSSLQARLQLMRRRDDPEFTRESLDTLQTHMNRIGRIVRGVSNVAHARIDGWTSVDLNVVLREATALVKLDERARDIEFIEALDEQLPAVRAIRDQMLQVVINLLLNAVEAMPDGGTLRAATYAEGGRVKLAVTDSGAGIDDAARTRLFQPFFTTKEHGTGLGLSISYSLVQGHGGVIHVSSKPGEGSCFTVDLPQTLVERAAHERTHFARR